MEERKIKEIEHYDELARRWQKNGGNSDIEMIDVMKMRSYRFLYGLLRKYVPGKKVLDYGCGHGMHAVPIAKMGAKEVVGIDLSEESIKIAQRRAKKESLGGKIKLLKMDAEALRFPDDYFDVVFDGGVFSSIDIEKGLEEIARVLKPGGTLIGIETLGHHPLANLKRWINKKYGIRTGWASEHIMKMGDFDHARRYFHDIDAFFFHFIGLTAIPFQKLPGGAILVSILEFSDTLLFKIMPFLKRFGFKTVFIFRK